MITTRPPTPLKNARYFLLDFNDVKISKPIILFRSSNILPPLERCTVTDAHCCNPRSDSLALKIVTVLRFKLLQKVTCISDYILVSQVINDALYMKLQYNTEELIATLVKKP
jgi:hypothetical protein